MRKPFYSVVTNKVATLGRIDIYGVIGSDWYDEGVTAKSFVRDLGNLEKAYDRIDIHINSPGGSIWDGLPMFNNIRASKKDIHTYVDGIALSMGAIILLAGHTVHAPKGSLIMLHNAGGGVAGNSKSLRKYADMLDKHDAVLVQLIADKTGKTAEEVIMLWMNMDDNWLTAEEAFEFGIVDVLEDYGVEDIPENVKKLNQNQIAAFYNERMEEPSPSLMTKIIDGVKTHLHKSTETNMKTLKIEALAGNAAPTDAQLEEANAELTLAGVTNATIVPESMITEAAAVTTERDGLVTANAALTSDLTVANNALTTAQGSVTTAEAATVTEATAHTATKALLAAANLRIAKGPGAKHAPGAGAKDEVVDDANDEDIEAILAAMPHNQTADKMFGAK